MKFLIFTIVLFFSPTVFAMKAACGSDASNLKKADIVFVGTVTKRKNIKEISGSSICRTAEKKPICGSKIATFNVDYVIKGKYSKTVKVSAGDACYCVSPYLNEGTRYILFGYKSKNNSTLIQSMANCASKPYNEKRVLKLKQLVKNKKI